MSFQREVGEWGEATFPTSTLDSILMHLHEEVNELDMAVHVPAGDDPSEEAADVYLILLHLAHRCGFSLEDAARLKMARNRTRAWHDDGRGYAKHVEEPQP